MKLQRDRMERHKRKRVEQYALIDKKQNNEVKSATRKITTHKTNTPMKNSGVVAMLYDNTYITPGTKNKHTNKRTSVNKTNVDDGGVSICLSAWNTQDYIEECLDSIANQTWFKTHDNWEILLGIDACEKTLAKVKEIMHKYKNLSVYMMNENVGTYVTCNTIMKLAKYEWLLRFDTDDVMMPNMVETMMKEKGDGEFVQCQKQDFGMRTDVSLAYGIALIKHSVINKFNGYRNWRCDGDNDFIHRIDKFVKRKKINKILFKRRVHETSLTVDKKTNFSSDVRREHLAFVNIPSNYATLEKCILPEYHLGNFTHIYTSANCKHDIIIHDKTTSLPMEDGVSILISAYGNKQYIIETLESIKKQTYKKYEILIGVDGDLDLLYFIQDNKEKFQNIRVFYYPKNLGPYLIFNSMVVESKYDKILRFDSDDIMPATYIEELVELLKNNDVVKPYGVNFGLNKNPIKLSHGSFLIRKNKFVEIGGFQPWVCDSDGEIFDRSQNTLKWGIAKDVIFQRRIHDNNLINDKNRGLKSKIRAEYREYRKNISPKCPIINYHIISITSKINTYCPIVSFTTYSRRLEIVSKMLDSIFNQTYKPYKIICSLTKEDYNKFPQKYKSKIEFIIIEQDLRPHNKYYYTMSKYRTYPIITVDDDYVYDSKLVQTLMKEYNKAQMGVFSLRTHEKTFQNSTLNPYKLWNKEIKSSTNKNKNLFATGVGGVLYSPNVLNVNETWLPVIQKYITVDDIVLNYYENIQNIPIYHITNNLVNKSIKETQKIGLFYNENIELNDVAINNLLSKIV